MRNNKSITNKSGQSEYCCRIVRQERSSSSNVCQGRLLSHTAIALAFPFVLFGKYSLYLHLLYVKLLNLVVFIIKNHTNSLFIKPVIINSFGRFDMFRWKKTIAVERQRFLSQIHGSFSFVCNVKERLT